LLIDYIEGADLQIGGRDGRCKGSTAGLEQGGEYIAIAAIFGESDAGEGIVAVEDRNTEGEGGHVEWSEWAAELYVECSKVCGEEEKDFKDGEEVVFQEWKFEVEI